MLNYAQVREGSYYAQNYASIMCQGLLWVLVRDTTVYTSTYSRGGGRFPSKSKRDRRKEGKEREVVEKGHMYFFALWCTISNPCTCTSVTSKNWEGGGHGAYETATPTPVSFWMNNILYSEKP